MNVIEFEELIRIYRGKLLDGTGTDRQRDMYNKLIDWQDNLWGIDID